MLYQLFIPQGFLMSPSKPGRDFCSSSWMETQAVNQGRAAHRLPGTPSQIPLFQLRYVNPGWALRLCGDKDSHAQAMAPAPRFGVAAQGTRAHGPGSIPPALPFQACPRAPPLPTVGRASSLDDNYRVKCQPHSQEHHYPLAN